MKNKKLFVIILCFALIILPLRESLAIAPIAIGGAIFLGGLALSYFFGGKIIKALENEVVKGIALLIKWITFLFHQLLWFINNSLLAPIIDAVSQLNPFSDVNYINEQGQERQVKSPITIIWNILKNFAYIILVFSALFAAYEWLLGEDANAKRLIFNIIIVALLINFTFVLVKEAFFIVDSFEKEITGGESKKIGTMIAASLWQKDPYREIANAINTAFPNNEEVSEALKAIAETIGYIFIIVFDMIILVVLVITALLFVVRYLMMILLSGTSSIALATLVFPEFKGALGQVFGTFKVWNTWLEYFLRWLFVVPVFIILVILGNILKENTLGQIQASDLIQFIILLFMLVGWYIISIIIANKISNGVANMGKVAATAAMLTIGGLAAKGLMLSVSPKIGNLLSKTGEKIEEKIGVGGILGWKSWVSQKIGKATREAGEKMIEKRYGLDAEVARSKIKIIDEQLRKEKNPEKQTKLTQELVNLTEKFKDNPYVLKQVSEELGRMSRTSFEKIATNKEAISLIAGSDKPQELRDKVIEQINKMNKDTLKNIFSNKELLETWTNTSPDIFNAFNEKLSKELNDADLLEQLTKPEIREFIPKLPDNLQKTINKVSKGFVEALMKKDLEAISNAMALWSDDAWSKTEKIDSVLKNYGFDDNGLKEILKNTLIRTKDPGIIINVLRGKPRDDTLKQKLALLTDDEVNQITPQLTPQQAAKFRAIISEVKSPTTTP